MEDVIWTYQLTNKRDNHECDYDYWESFETQYEGKPVTLEIRVGNPVSGIMPGIRLNIWDENRENALGILNCENETAFIRTINDGLQEACEPPRETPSIEAFVQRYKHLFESQRDLREKFGSYL